jgi:rod shape-determining protein MreC
MSRSSIIALVVFVVVTGLVLSLRASVARAIQARALEVVRPIHQTTSGVSRSLGAFGKGVKRLDELERENAVLTVQNEELRATNQMMRDLADENRSLRQALDFRQRSDFKLLPARIIARSSSTWWSTVQIDRGEQDGLDSDMPVVTDVGLVGKTTTVAANTAYVLLIVDENCKVAGTVEGTREQGILSGERTSSGVQPDLVLSFLSKTAELHAGQKVFSSGVGGGVFPSGLLLGTVRDFQVRALDGRAEVVPAVDFSKLENVFVVLGTKPAPKK